MSVEGNDNVEVFARRMENQFDEFCSEFEDVEDFDNEGFKCFLVDHLKEVLTMVAFNIQVGDNVRNSKYFQEGVDFTYHVFWDVFTEDEDEEESLPDRDELLDVVETIYYE
jgi:hypothetical protein